MTDPIYLVQSTKKRWVVPSCTYYQYITFIVIGADVGPGVVAGGLGVALGSRSLRTSESRWTSNMNINAVGNK